MVAFIHLTHPGVETNDYAVGLQLAHERNLLLNEKLLAKLRKLDRFLGSLPL